MLIDLPHWETINQAQTSLLGALSQALDSPSLNHFQPLLTYTPPDRPQARDATTKLITDLSAVIRQLEALRLLQEELGKLYWKCKSIKSALVSCISPIGSLPDEIIQSIIELAIESPSQTPQVMALSHVCRKWRRLVLDASSLFVAPDWLCWPSELQDIWVSRSRKHFLEARISEQRSTRAAQYRLETVFSALQLRAERLRTIRLSLGDGYQEIPDTLQDFLKSHMPNIEIIVISGGRNGQATLQAASMPRLHTLHSSELQLSVVGKFESLQNLGWRVYAPIELHRLSEVTRQQSVDFHLTIFAHTSEGLEESLSMYPLLGQEYWAHLFSLRIHGFMGDDYEWFDSLISQIHAPRLRSLELLEMGHQVFRALLSGIPTITSSSITTLILAGFSQGTLADFLIPLNRRADDSPTPFPNLSEVIIQDLTDISTHLGDISLPALTSFVAARKGSLRRLVLPSRVDPARQGIEEPPLPYTHLRRPSPLTLEEAQALQQAGDLLELKYTYNLDNHGFDLTPPGYYDVYEI